jgi:hypothetical protein
MARLVVVANCQASALGRMLARASTRVDYVPVPAIHAVKGEAAEKMLATIAEADVCIHQPIGPKFGDLCTDSLRDRFAAKTFVSFPSIFFGGLFPDLFYLRKRGGGTLVGPLGDYHDRRIVNAFLSQQPEADCVRTLQENGGDHRAQFDEAMAESKRRDLSCDVPIMDVLEDMIGFGRPLFTFNHPTNAVLWALALRVLDRLELPKDGQTAPPITQFLNAVTATTPRTLLEDLGAPWRSDVYEKAGQAMSFEGLVGSFYELYASQEDFGDIYRFNLSRFGSTAKHQDLGGSLERNAQPLQ